MREKWQAIFFKIALLLAVVTLPLTIQINSVAIILLSIAWLASANFKDKYDRLLKANWLIPFIFFYVLHIIGLLYSSNLSDGAFELEKKLSFLLLPIIIGSSPAISESFFTILKRSFIASCVFVMIVSLVIAWLLAYDAAVIPQNFDLGTNTDFRNLNPQASPTWQYFSYLQIGEWIDLHPAYFSMYLIFAIAILLQELLEEKGLVVWKVAILVLISFFLTLLASRMALITFLAVLLFYGFRCLRKRKPAMVLITPAVLITAGLLIVLNPVTRFRLWQEPAKTNLKISEQTTEWTSVSLRVLEWQSSLNTIKQYWVKGVGTGGVQQALLAYYSKFNTNTFNTSFNSHNQYLQTFMELGFIGLLSLLIIIAFTSKTAIQNKDTLYLSFIVIFCFMCLTESMLERQKGIIFFTLFHSLFLNSKS